MLQTIYEPVLLCSDFDVQANIFLLLKNSALIVEVKHLICRRNCFDLLSKTPVRHLEGKVELLKDGPLVALFDRNSTFAQEEVISLLGLQLHLADCGIGDALQDLSSVQKLGLHHEPEADLVNNFHVPTCLLEHHGVDGRELVPHVFGPRRFVIGTLVFEA